MWNNCNFFLVPQAPVAAYLVNTVDRVSVILYCIIFCLLNFIAVCWLHDCFVSEYTKRGCNILCIIVVLYCAKWGYCIILLYHCRRGYLPGASTIRWKRWTLFVLTLAPTYVCNYLPWMKAIIFCSAFAWKSCSWCKHSGMLNCCTSSWFSIISF